MGMDLTAPLMLALHYSDEIGMMTMRPIEHTRPCVTFSEEAADYCGGAVERDEDGYIVRCAFEVEFVDTMRRLSKILQSATSQDK
jgi:hypothetical protein